MKDSLPRIFLIIILAVAWVYFLHQSPWATSVPEANSNQPLTLVGTTLFEGYGAVFSTVALLLVAALLGAVFLAKEEI